MGHGTFVAAAASASASTSASASASPPASGCSARGRTRANAWQGTALRRPGTELHERSTIPDTLPPKRRPADALHPVASPRLACLLSVCFGPPNRPFAGTGPSSARLSACHSLPARDHGLWLGRPDESFGDVTQTCTLPDPAAPSISPRATRQGPLGHCDCCRWYGWPPSPFAEDAQLLDAPERNGHRRRHQSTPLPGSAGRRHVACSLVS
ncbi:hypothetical protein SNOG_13288 [Parastagonospora nodorum SN15]|uniref:Uncharacterized protein n=1 Tax=Phaeosphaeria nodorum (strain SN15 / ATCC MYA-4574 / FGSC 10173) TaxID=321614 RepID=Q0U4M6_PHANO|nr:hypothetical protein SNOG_13288 [Parastagonospora nodorum SN15]EAT79172.1 hypothetical protein SNOG_13288 [Parastagonospora nodorum SN15]